MVSLGTAGRRFDSLMYRLDGFPFMGTVEPTDEGELPSYDWSIPRIILRTDPTCPVGTGDMITDVAGRIYLLADHDVSFAYNVLEHKTNRMFHMRETLEWKREVKAIDPLTKREKSSGIQTIGQVLCLVERVEREYMDTTLRTKEEVRKVISGTKLELGDILDGMVVKRVDQVLGIWLTEIQ